MAGAPDIKLVGASFFARKKERLSRVMTSRGCHGVFVCVRSISSNKHDFSGPSSYSELSYPMAWDEFM